MAVQWAAYLCSLLVYLTMIPAPIGIIGAWRWGVWGVRRCIGSFYRPLPPVVDYNPRTSLVIPVYNEVPDVFRAALRSWAANKPTEIIAVIDHSDQQCMQIFREFEQECASSALELKMIITKKPGKRPALVDGMMRSSGEIIFLVDSDTIWAPDVLVNAIAPFVDPAVGGVTTRQSVLAPNALAQRLFDVYLDIRYIDEIRFLAAFEDTPFGDAVTCLSGRTAVYRRSAVIPVLDGLLNETFLGRRVISGDDKALTLLVQGQRWKVRYQETARVYTPGATEMKSFWKQRLRWARNSWRADLRALSSGWAWHKPLLVFHLLDRLAQPLTTLIGPLYLISALVQRHWSVVAFLLFWWLVSRTVKIWPHIRRNYRNIRILPWYVVFSYWTAIVKIYAFFTMNQQGWITRWNQSRLSLAGPLRLVPGYAFTGLTLVTFAWVVNGVHYQSVAYASSSVREVKAVVERTLPTQATLPATWQSWLPAYCPASPDMYIAPQLTQADPAPVARTP